MPDPKLLAVKATIAYKSSDGYHSEETLGAMRVGADDPINVPAAQRAQQREGQPAQAQPQKDSNQ